MKYTYTVYENMGVSMAVSQISGILKDCKYEITSQDYTTMYNTEPTSQETYKYLTGTKVHIFFFHFHTSIFQKLKAGAIIFVINIALDERWSSLI